MKIDATTVMEVIVAVVVLLFVIYFKDSKFKEQTAFYAAGFKVGGAT